MKTATKGRPHGPAKQALNIYFNSSLLKKVRNQAKKEGRNISTVMERAFVAYLEKNGFDKSLQSSDSVTVGTGVPPTNGAVISHL